MASETNETVTKTIAAVVILLMAIGTVFVFSASAKLTLELNIRRFYDYPPLRQMLFFPLGCLVLHIGSKIDYRLFSFARGWSRSLSTYGLAVSVVLLAIVLVPGIGTEINYARRWLRIPLGAFRISFQPSELAKWATIFFTAAFCDHFQHQLRLFWKRFVPLMMIVGLVVALIVVEDVGTAAFICLLVFLMLLLGGAKWWHLLGPLPPAALGFAAMVLRSPARMRRITAFLHPEKWADSAAYQANQSLIAISSGGLWGTGLGRGICKYDHLPEDTTDFIFAIIGEELGFVGNLAVIVLFMVFLWLGLLVVTRCKDRFGQLLASGIVLAIGMQAALNIGVVTVVLPTKGIPLPFVSAGGTSMLMSSAAVGILLNIASQASRQEQPLLAISD